MYPSPARGGVAKGTIYNYFKGKEELLHALAEGIAGVMHRNLENVTSSENEGLPLKDRLMKVVAPLTDGTPRSKRNLRVFRLVWAEGLRSPEIMHDLYARLFVPVFRNDGLLARMLEKEDVPDFVRNRPVVLVAPLIQSIFIHVLVGNELIRSPREYISDDIDFILSKNAREEHVPDVRLPGEDA